MSILVMDLWGTAMLDLVVYWVLVLLGTACDCYYSRRLLTLKAGVLAGCMVGLERQTGDCIAALVWYNCHKKASARRTAERVSWASCLSITTESIQFLAQPVSRRGSREVSTLAIPRSRA